MQAEPTSQAARDAATLWDERTRRLLERALEEVGESADVVATISAAETAARIALGELPEDELSPSWYETDEEAAVREEAECECPAELRGRGFSSRCPVQGAVAVGELVGTSQRASGGGR